MDPNLVPGPESQRVPTRYKILHVTRLCTHYKSLHALKDFTVVTRVYILYKISIGYKFFQKVQVLPKIQSAVSNLAQRWDEQWVGLKSLPVYPG